MSPKSFHKVFTIVDTERWEPKEVGGKLNGTELIDYLRGVMQ